MKKLLLILIAILFLSCEKEKLSYPKMEIAIFYPDDPKYYIWSDLENPSMGWEERLNGKDFTFINKDEKLKIHSERDIKQAYILIGKTFREFQLKDSLEVTEEMTFRFKF